MELRGCRGGIGLKGPPQGSRYGLLYDRKEASACGMLVLSLSLKRVQSWLLSLSAPGGRVICKLHMQNAYNF